MKDLKIWVVSFGKFLKKRYFPAEEKKHPDVEILTDFTFIWYKRTLIGGKTTYTQPFRTKVSAVDYKQAIEKLERFALNKTKLIIITEEEFGKTDISHLQGTFQELGSKMDEVFEKFN